MSSEPMKCDHVAERLPFFLNDSLSEGEREAVRRHLEACETCAEDLERARDVWRLHATHPAPGDLVAHLFAIDRRGTDQDGTHENAADREVIEAHLTVCAACREEAELLAQSRDLPAADHAVARPTFGRPADRPEAGDARSTAWPRLAAAAILIASAALGAWAWQAWSAARDGWGSERAALERRIEDLERRLDDRIPVEPESSTEPGELRSELERLREQVAELSEPSLNVASVELFADGDLARSPNGAAPVTVPNRSQPVHLLLVAPEASVAPADVRVRFLDAAGQEVWRGTGLRRQTAGEYSIHLPAGLLPTGRVTLVLEEARRGDWTPVAGVPLDVGD